MHDFSKYLKTLKLISGIVKHEVKMIDIIDLVDLEWFEWNFKTPDFCCWYFIDMSLFWKDKTWNLVYLQCLEYYGTLISSFGRR